MRNKLFGTFLFCTTAFYSPQAHAMPFIAPFIGGILTSFGATALGGSIAGLAFGTGAAFSAGFGFASSALGGILIKAAFSLGLSALASLLRPRPQTSNPGNKLVNLRQPVHFFEYVYGTVRKGGPVNFWKAKDGFRYYDVIFAAHEIHRYKAYYLDEREVTIDGASNVIEAEFTSGGIQRMHLRPYRGAPGQLSDALLQAVFPEWTSAHNMAGLAHIVASARNTKAEDFSKIYPTGREPAITPVIEGMKCYDPRDNTQVLGNRSTYKFTQNAALVIADWVVSKAGLGAEIDDWAKVAIEANESDSIILDRLENPVKKWQLCGSYSSADPRDIVRAQMGVACDAFFYETSSGKVGFNVGRYIAPTVTISDADILRIQYQEGQQGTEIANAQIVEYTEPVNGYRESAAATYAIAAPNEAYTEDSLQVFWIPNHNQAVRIEKRLLTAARARYKISASLKYHGVRLIGERNFRLVHSEMGIDRTFEVDRLTRADDGQTWNVEAHSIDSQDFTFISSTEEPAPPVREALTLVETVPEPTGITAVAQAFAGSVAIYVDFDDPPRDSLINQIRHRVRSPAGAWFTTPVPVGQSYQNIIGLVDGETYDVHVRAVTGAGKASNWAPHTDPAPGNPTLFVTAIANVNAPVALTAYTATGGAGIVTNNFTTAAGDANLAKISIYRAPTGVALNPTTHFVTDIGAAPGTAFSFGISGVPAGVWDMYARTKNGSNIGTATTGPRTVTVT
jgi:hypothetical protein